VFDNSNLDFAAYFVWSILRKQVLHYIENGATCPILYPLGDVKAMIDTFSDWDGVS
jgi:hypothetical protein